MQNPNHRQRDRLGNNLRPGMNGVRPKVALAALRLVRPHELDLLRQSLRRGAPPLDLCAKLDRLRGDDPQEHYLKQRSTLLIGLLTAVEAGEFHLARAEDRERLLQVLAYVRKDDDAIPDSQPGGFVDDHDLMRRVCGELNAVLDSYKAWHLARRVPRLWPATQVAAPRPSAVCEASGPAGRDGVRFSGHQHSRTLCSY